jgi:hypothetical protein
MGDWRVSGEPLVEGDVKTSLIVLAGVEMLLVSGTFFLLDARGFFAKVPAGWSCHFSLTPYPLQVILRRVHRWQKGFCSSHLYPASLQVQHPVRVRLCVVAMTQIYFRIKIHAFQALHMHDRCISQGGEGLFPWRLTP